MDLSHNKIREVTSLNPLKNLLVLKLDFNLIKNARLEPMPFLQQASFSNNMIQTTEGIAHPKLEILNLKSN